MNIIAFTTELDASRGGKQLSMLDVCQRLFERGHQINLLYLENGNLLQEYQKFCDRIIEIPTFDIEKKHPFISSLKFAKSLFRIFGMLQGSHPSLIYVDDHKCCLFAYALSKLLKVPSIFHIRQPLLEEFPRKYLIAIRRIQSFIAVSKQVQASWHTAGIEPDRITVVYNGIDPQIFQPVKDWTELRQQSNFSIEDKIISYIGRIDQQKGIETLISAFAELIKLHDRNRLKLLIAGRPVLHASRRAGEEYLQSLKEKITRLKLIDQVYFLGYCPNPISLYQMSDVTVLPSVYPEPFGRSVIESMACGIPVLGSNVGGIPEILTGEFENCLFRANHDHELSKKLSDLIFWRERNSGLGSRCRDHVVSNFSIEKTVQEIEKIMLKVARPQPISSLRENA